MKVYACQLDIVWEDKAANHEKVRRLLDARQIAPGSLVVLPEMFATGFSMNVAGITETPLAESETFLSELAGERRIFVVGGVVRTGADGRGRNEAAVFGPDGAEIGRYCKMQPFPLAGEDRHFAAGDGPAFFEWDGFKAAPFICYDLRFPEHFRHAARQGAELIVVIANWPRPRDAHWTALLTARAIENQAYVVGVNRCGTDPGFVYAGCSRIIDPRGEILADAGNGESVVVAQLDREVLLKYRRDFPALKDIRNDCGV